MKCEDNNKMDVSHMCCEDGEWIELLLVVCNGTVILMVSNVRDLIPQF
jgi:hypothetical protein